MTPTIDVFITTIQSTQAIRSRHERVMRAMQAARVPFRTHDVAADEQAKRFWQKKDSTRELPCILVDDERVGSVEQLDEALGYGELRQFLRLDTPSPAPPPLPAKPASPDPSNGNDNGRRPSLVDFAALDLTAAEAAQLEAELAAGQTFDSALASPPVDKDKSYASSSTLQHEVLPLRLTKHDQLTGDKYHVVRPLGNRPLASKVPRGDDYQHLNDVGEDELEALARQLEEEEEAEKVKKGKRIMVEARERARRTDEDRLGAELPHRPSSAAPPPLPDKEEPIPSASSTTLPMPAPIVPSNASVDSSAVADPLRSQTSIENASGAELSAPIAQIDQLRLSPDEVAELEDSVARHGTELSVKQPDVDAVVEETEGMSGRREYESDEKVDERQTSSNKPGTSRSGVDKEQLKAGLKREASRAEELPDVVAAAVAAAADQSQSQRRQDQILAEDGVDERVVQAVKGGEL